MKIITLPDELKLEELQTVQIFDYNSSLEIAKQQIVLNQNAISFLLEGTKEVVFDNSFLSISNSQFLVMKSGHCLMTERLSNDGKYRSILLFFSSEVLQKIIRKNEFDSSKSNKEDSVYAFNYDEFIKGFVRSLLDVSKLSKKVQHKLLELKLEEVMLYLVDKFGMEFLYSLVSHSNDLTQKFTKVVETNMLNKLTIKELAFLCNMSESTFKREFVKYYSESPMKWFQNKRLEYAHHLLTTQQKNASDIYYEVGYESLSSFIQAYKIKFGSTPKQQHKS
jgi:AraC-like DNA-binding protein